MYVYSNQSRVEMMMMIRSSTIPLLLSSVLTCAPVTLILVAILRETKSLLTKVD